MTDEDVRLLFTENKHALQHITNMKGKELRDVVVSNIQHSLARANPAYDVTVTYEENSARLRVRTEPKVRDSVTLSVDVSDLL